jgi:hypothetical protein
MSIHQNENPARADAMHEGGGLGNPLGVGQTLLMRAPLGQHMDAPAVPHGTSTGGWTSGPPGVGCFTELL